MTIPPGTVEAGDAAGGAVAATGSSGDDAPRRLHPATLLVRWLRFMPQMLGGGAAYGFATAREAPGRILLFIGIAVVIGAVLALLGWWRFRYRVGADEIGIESGILNRQRRVIPFDRVQDVAIERPLLARLFGTARVRIETGGSAADEGTLDMIGLAEAHALRDRLRKLPPRYGEGDQGEQDGGVGTAGEMAAEQEPVLFALRFGRLVYSGLFNFSLLFLAVVFAVVQNLDEIGLVRIEDWLTPERADAARGYFSLRLALVLVPLLLLLGIVSGVARTVARDFGFRLTRSGGAARPGLRRRRGLFTLSEVVIPIRRAQVALIESGPVTRWLGWHALSFETLGADQKEGGVQAAAPFARIEEILPILAEAGFPAPPPRARFVHPPRRALVRWAGQYVAVGFVAVAAALLFEPWVGIGAGAMGLLAVYGLLHWRRHAYAIDAHALYVSRGLLKRRLSIIPFERAQTISVSAGPLQRRLRLASLLVDTAGASLMRAPEIVDLDAGDAEKLADRLLALFYEARARRRMPQ